MALSAKNRPNWPTTSGRWQFLPFPLSFPPLKTMNISLPPTLRSYVREQAVERGYGTASAYVRELIRRDQDRQHLRGLLLEGAESPPSVTADEAYFESLRTGVRRRSKA